MHSSNLPYARSSEIIIGPVKCYSWSVDVDADTAEIFIQVDMDIDTELIQPRTTVFP